MDVHGGFHIELTEKLKAQGTTDPVFGAWNFDQPNDHGKLMKTYDDIWTYYDVMGFFGLVFGGIGNFLACFSCFGSEFDGLYMDFDDQTWIEDDWSRQLCQISSVWLVDKIADDDWDFRQK